MDIEKLKEKMEEIKIPISVISQKLGISRQSLYKKLTGEREFKVSEVTKIAAVLRLTNEEKEEIFFTNQVDKNDTNTIAEEN